MKRKSYKNDIKYMSNDAHIITCIIMFILMAIIKVRFTLINDPGS